MRVNCVFLPSLSETQRSTEYGIYARPARPRVPSPLLPPPPPSSPLLSPPPPRARTPFLSSALFRLAHSPFSSPNPISCFLSRFPSDRFSGTPPALLPHLLEAARPDLPEIEPPAVHLLPVSHVSEHLRYSRTAENNKSTPPNDDQNVIRSIGLVTPAARERGRGAAGGGRAQRGRSGGRENLCRTQGTVISLC